MAKNQVNIKIHSSHQEMLTEPNVLIGLDPKKRALFRPNTSLSSSAIGTIGVGGGAINSTCDSNGKITPSINYISQRHHESFYSLPKKL
jgi:hypothetical protein